MKVVNLMDFRGGYFTDTPAELMKDNELLKAENCQWRDGMTKRKGIAPYSTSDWSALNAIKGAIRVYVNGAWVTIIALEQTSKVTFRVGSGTTFTAIDVSYEFATGCCVHFAELDDHIVAVNGVNKPAVIYWDATLATPAWVVENLETYDTRDFTKTNCFAGKWDDDGDPTFIDDSAVAYDVTNTAAEFELSDGATDDDGIYIACDYAFNKVVFVEAELDATAVAEYAYWNGTSWTTFTPDTAPTWSGATGDKTLEFDWPFDGNKELLWQRYTEDDSSGINGVPNRYIIRIRFTTAGAAAFGCDYLTVHNTQYLSLILQDARPHTVYTHNGTMFLAERWILNFSAYHSVKNWRERNTEFFEHGGEKIQQLISFQDVLVVFKENAIYTYNTTSLSDPVRSRPLAAVGAAGGRSAAVVGGLLFFVARDGIYVWDGSRANRVSRHIQSDFDSWTTANAAGIKYQDEYWVSFPTNGITLTVDPDTFRRDGAGNGVMSFYKFTGYTSYLFYLEDGAGDNGYLLALVDEDPPRIDRCDNGLTDNSVAIPMSIQTRYFDFAGFQKHKFMGRFKPKIKEVSAVTGSTHTLTAYSDDGTKTIVITLTVPVGSGYYSKDISLPYTMDGKNISFELSNEGLVGASLIGYALELTDRRF